MFRAAKATLSTKPSTIVEGISGRDKDTGCLSARELVKDGMSLMNENQLGAIRKD